MRWTDFGSDPNTADVVNWRAQGVRRARAQPISDRIEYIKQLAANKRVLDVGVVDHTIGHQHSADWLHGAIASVAASVVGCHGAHENRPRWGASKPASVVMLHIPHIG